MRGISSLVNKISNKGKIHWSQWTLKSTPSGKILPGNFKMLSPWGSSMETVTSHPTLCIKINPPLRENKIETDDENADHWLSMKY